MDTFTSTQVLGFDMINASSPNGTIGLKGDSGSFVNGTIALDELRILQGVMDAGQIQTLFSVNIVPEPSSFALLGIGAMLFGVFRSRRS